MSPRKYTGTVTSCGWAGPSVREFVGNEVGLGGGGSVTGCPDCTITEIAATIPTTTSAAAVVASQGRMLLIPSR